MNSTSRYLAAILSIFALATTSLPGQEPEAAAEKLAAISIGDLEISEGNLALLINPLTKAELAAEVEAWQKVVRSATEEVSRVSIAGENSAAALEAHLKALNRFSVVLDEFEAKGGDGAEFRTYATAVSGSGSVDLTDAGATVNAFTTWLTSREGGIKLGLDLLKFLAVLFVFWIIARIVRGAVRKAAARSNTFSELLEQFVIKMSFRTVMFIGVLVALGTLGVNVSAMLALIGGASFIIGFALQDTLGNFASGVMLLIYRPFDVGNSVEVGGVTGKIDQVSLVSTKIRTFDNKVVLVPNQKVWGEVITNASASEERRVDMVFGIGYEDDVEKAKEIMGRIVSGHDKVLAEPAPVIQLHELADSSVNFICRPWVKTSDYWDVHWDVTGRVKLEFDKAGISIPFPQQDVHVHQVAP